MQISPEEARRELARRELERRRLARAAQNSVQQQPEDMGAQRRQRADSIAQERFGRPFSELSWIERRRLGADPSLVAQGLSFGYFDEALAGSNALTQGASNVFRRATGQPITRTMGDAYQDSHALLNTALEDRRQNAPILSALLEASGGLAVGPARAAVGGGFNAIRSAAPAVAPSASAGQALARTAANVGRGAAFGAAGGAAYGSGVADQGERLQGARQGALIGGAVGAAVPLTTATGGALWRNARQARPDRQIIQAGQRAGLGDDLPQQLTNARTDDFLAEAVGGRARRIAQGVPGLSEEAAEVAQTAISDRAARRFNRLISTVRNVAQDDGTRAATRNVEAMRKAAAPLFRQVDENIVSATPSIREHVRALRRAGISFADADRITSLEGGAPVRLSALADDMDLPNEVRLGDIRALIGSAESNSRREFRTGDPQVGRALANRARALRNALKDVDPRFREASRLWHSAAQDEQAISLGRDVFAGRAGAADELEDFVRGGMSDTERRGFLQGVSQAIEARAARAAEQGGNSASRFNPRFIRDRLRLVFGQDADQIMTVLDDLNAQAAFESMALRNANSATAGRREATQAATEVMRTGPAGALRDIGGTLSLKGPRNALADLIEGTPDQAATDISRLLFRPADPQDDVIQALLQAQKRRRGLFGRAAPDTLPAFAGAGAVSAAD